MIRKFDKVKMSYLTIAEGILKLDGQESDTTIGKRQVYCMLEQKSRDFLSEIKGINSELV